MNLLLLFKLPLLLASAPIAEDALDIRIPVVDLTDYQNPDKHDEFIDTLFDAMRTVGFFAVRNTGVDRNVIDNAYGEAKTFFKRESDFKKTSFVKELNGQRGFVPSERAKGQKAKDIKEFYHIGRELPEHERARLGIMPNVWPNQPHFKESMLTLYRELERHSAILQEAIVETINKKASIPIPSHFLTRMTKNGESLLRSIYYPPLSKEEVDNLKEPLYWAAAHTDIDLLAILPYATEKGLQVEIDGQWLNVVVPEDAFIVNVGDMLENITNGLFVSARHRVLAQEPQKERFSMVLFIHPLDDARLDPLEACIEQTGGVQCYAPGTRKEFLWERLLELNVAPHLLEPYSKTGHAERQAYYGRQSPQVVEMLVDNNLASKELYEILASCSCDDDEKDPF